MQRTALMLTDRPQLMIYYIGYFLLHLGRHGQDVSRAKKYTQDVENPINLTRNEKL